MCQGRAESWSGCGPGKACFKHDISIVVELKLQASWSPPALKPPTIPCHIDKLLLPAEHLKTCLIRWLKVMCQVTMMCQV